MKHLHTSSTSRAHDKPYPAGDTLDVIRSDPIFCHVCCNLSAGSALSLIPRNDIFYTEAVNKDMGDAVGEVPAWAGISRFDLAAWEFTAGAMDVNAASEAGCKGCGLLKKGIEVGLGSEHEALAKSWFDSKKIDISVIFRAGRVMRVYVVEKDSNDDEDDEYGAGLSFEDWESGFRGKTLETFEFYTLEGMPQAASYDASRTLLMRSIIGSPCPWPSIGSSMAFEDPETDGRGATWKGGKVKHVLESPYLDAGIARIRNWVSDCDRWHNLCTMAIKPRQDRVLPKRLINVGQDEFSVHLVQLESTFPAQSAYTALSHCWGKSQHLITTSTNIREHEANISWNELPKTFQDAILITRILGIQYIWIDSLCIIQDSGSDWEEEAAKMGSIYFEAYLVIAATGSSDGDGGCFLARSGYNTIRGGKEDESNWQAYIRRERVHSSFGWRAVNHQEGMSRGPPEGRERNYEDYPLFKRAWCYQERMLGTRVLHFTPSEMVFECVTSSSCECGAIADFEEDPMLGPRRLLAISQASASGLSWEPGFGDYFLVSGLGDYFLIWRHAVMEYSRRSITRATDMLPALGGLASKWSLIVKCRYLAGLWSEDILRGLLWKADSPDPKYKDDMYLSPSWSWVNIRRGVRWVEQAAGRPTNFYVSIDLDKTSCLLKGRNEYGELTGGWLFITGPVIKGTLTSVRHYENSEPYGFVNMECSDRTIAFVADSVSRCEQCLDQEITILRFCTDINDEKTGQGFGRALVLRLMNQETINQPGHVKEWKGGIYQRLGVMEYLYGDHWDEEKATISSFYII